MKDADRLSQLHGKNDVGAALQLTQSNPNPTPPSASADNEQLRKKVIGSLSRAQVQDVDVMGEATIEREADHIMRLVALHTKEAERAKMVELRDQWGVWLDDSADDKQTIREIYDWLDREIEFHDREAK